MRLEVTHCRALLSDRRHLILATVGEDARPHAVPVTFAWRRPPGHDPDGDVLVVAVDRKPKTTTELQRVRNVRANPRVALLAEHYDEDWTALWWVRLDALAEVLDGGPRHEAAIDALVERYPQYRSARPPGPVLWIEVQRWSGWAAS